MPTPLHYKRIYFYHIRRVGGTSLNQSFFGLCTTRPEFISENLRRSREKIISVGGSVFVGANREVLQTGSYLYGFSHIPSHRLSLPPDTFTIALFRDPADRIVSHYRMILDHDSRDIERSWLARERRWLGNTFHDFLANLPRERLLAQLFMFSADFDVSEALTNIRRCSHYFHASCYQSGLARLATLTRLPLKLRHAHRSRIAVELPPRERKHLRALLAPEYELLRQLWPEGC